MEDESALIRNGIAGTSGTKLPSPVLMEYVLRSDNDIRQRVSSAAVLLARGWEDPSGRLNELLPELMTHWEPLVFEMGKHGDERVVPILAEWATHHTYSMSATSALGNIHTKESVEALIDLLQNNQDAGDTAAVCLKCIYKRHQ